ncbi:MFS transporter [Streptomyces noursei]|uniref:MFS transporter n=1 Tax=Streptomyces noursei TaxID=1971 RepID=UPI001C63D5DB|nr:MFS transporter [Streptomyces noursei]
MSRIPGPARPSARGPQRALPTPPSPDRRHWAALAVLLLGAFMGFLDIFIVNVAAPAIQTEWHAPFADVQLVPAGYTLAYAAGLVTGGRLGDVFGRRRVFLYGVGTFAVTSAGCALATTPAFLIGARLLQGLAAAAMLPQVLALIQVTFPQDRARARALGLYGAVIGAGVLAGQILGGLLVAWDIAGLGWRTVFLVNVPLCAVTFVGAALLVGEDRTAVAGRLDLSGASLLGLGLFEVVHALVTGPERGWTAVPSCELATGIALLGLFLIWERRVERAGRTPLLPPRLLAQRGFSRGLPTVVCFYGANGAFVFLLAFHLQHALGFSPLGSALEFVPMAVLTSGGVRAVRADGGVPGPMDGTGRRRADGRGAAGGRGRGGDGRPGRPGGRPAARSSALRLRRRHRGDVPDRPGTGRGRRGGRRGRVGRHPHSGAGGGGRRGGRGRRTVRPARRDRRRGARLQHLGAGAGRPVGADRGAPVLPAGPAARALSPTAGRPPGPGRAHTPRPRRHLGAPGTRHAAGPVTESPTPRPPRPNRLGFRPTSPPAPPARRGRCG